MWAEETTTKEDNKEVMGDGNGMVSVQFGRPMMTGGVEKGIAETTNLVEAVTKTEAEKAKGEARAPEMRTTKGIILKEALGSSSLEFRLIRKVLR